MTDDYPAYYNAWVQIFRPTDHRLLCSWHALRNWNKKILEITDLELRKTVKADLMNIQKELNEHQYLKKHEYFLKKYSNHSCEKFLKYYKSNYMNRAQHWAYCYRKNLGINTNMYLENLHRKEGLHFSFFPCTCLRYEK